MNHTDEDNVFIVIAAYNESKIIEETLANVRRYFKHIVVVDDCSTDNTYRKASQEGVFALRHPINLGQGAALETGVRFALQKGAEYIVTFDADNQHNAAEILPMLKQLKESPAEIALGSRFLGQTVHLPWQRLLILKLGILYTYLTIGIKFSDVHNGFRVMTKHFCEKFRFTQNRMAHASEILNYIAEHNIKFIECPVTITYNQYSLDKGQRTSNSLRILMELFTRHIAK